MSEAKKRILVGAGLVLALGAVVGLQYFGLPAVQVASVIVALAMIAEFLVCLWRNRGGTRAAALPFMAFFALLVLVAYSAYFVGARPWIMLLLLMTICGADIGAWLFGKWLGGDKMWERLSAGKTWSGQIAGIICGTSMAILYGLLGTDTFMPQLMWIGISVSLLSQYGDLTASWIKRRLGIKDFGRILPGHGGILDRFDGWIYVLPLIWLVMM